MRKKLSDTDFIHLFERLGSRALARRIGINERAILARRRRLEASTGHPISPPHIDYHNQFHPPHEEHPARATATIKDGVVLIGSDAHYFPGLVSTAHRALVRFCRELKPRLVVLNGDVIDAATISRFPPVGWERRPTLISEIEAAQERLAELEAATKYGCDLWWPIGNHDCLDTETECLTRRGWLKHDELRNDDEILSWVGGSAVWSGVHEIVTFPYSGKMICLEKNRMSMCVTPNHRVLLHRLNWRSRRYDVTEFVQADQLPWSFNIPTAGIAHNEEVQMADEEIALTGWLLTDGCYGDYNVSLYQSKPSGRQEIERLLTTLGYEFSRYERQRGIRYVCGRALLKEPLIGAQYLVRAADSKKIRSYLPDKTRLPEWACRLSQRQFEILLEAIVAGDGVWDGNAEAKKCCVIYGREPILSSMQSIAVQHGWRARLAVDNRGDHRLCLSKISSLRIERPEITERDYVGDVWCLRVPHGNFMVRRRGCAYFTGNSRFATRLATVAPEYAKLHGTRIKDHFNKRWQPCWAGWINNAVVIKHRFKGGIHATHNNTLHAGKTMVTGHLHSLKVTPFDDYNGTRWGVDTGTLADPYGIQFLNYTEDAPKNHRSGFAVLTFKGGRLLWPELVYVIDEKQGLVGFRGDVLRV